MMLSNNNEQNGISRPAAVVWLVAGLICLLPAAQVRANDDSVRALIQQAGNTDSDEARLDYLKQLRKQPVLDASVKDDLDKLITQIERWLNEKRLDYFGGDVRRDKDFDFKIAETLRINFEGYTSEVNYTDRVLRFPSLFTGNGILGKADVTIRRPDPSLLYSMVTGDSGKRQSIETDEFVVDSRRTRVNFKLPPRKSCVLYISRL